MANGIYEVHFRSNIHDFGSGLIVIKDGSINGGDANFLYRGALTLDGETAHADISVDLWKSGNTSVVNIDHFKIVFRGTVSGGSLKLTGHVEGQPELSITVTGQKVADAA
ncbi:hypothetical protein QYE80_08070 [Pseudomonas tohonis]|nr:hypothetical protein L682_27345 [Pseudomonas alcaligenes OT 69]MDN4144930.1 hypothetical protein [Pseudomonas tohonis]